MADSLSISQPLKQRVDVFRTNRAVIIWTHLDDRRNLAGSQALKPPQRKGPVSRGLSRLHPEPLLKTADHLLSAQQGATEVVAYPDLPPPAGLEAEHIVEGGHLRHLGRRQPETLAQLANRLRCHMPRLLLTEVQQRKKRGPAMGITGQDLLYSLFSHGGSPPGSECQVPSSKLETRHGQF